MIEELLERLEQSGRMNDMLIAIVKFQKKMIEDLVTGNRDHFFRDYKELQLMLKDFTEELK